MFNKLFGGGQAPAKQPEPASPATLISKLSDLCEKLYLQTKNFETEAKSQKKAAIAFKKANDVPQAIYALKKMKQAERVLVRCEGRIVMVEQQMMLAESAA